MIPSRAVRLSGLLAAFLAALPAITAGQETNPMLTAPASRVPAARPQSPRSETIPPRAVPRPAPASPPRTAIQPAPGPQAPRAPVSPAYERPMLELSEAIGSLAFLSALCNPGALPNPWQRRMEALVESEGEANANSDKLMGAYNAGYQAFSTTYRQCTDAAEAARSLLVRDAARLAREVERRFGS